MDGPLEPDFLFNLQSVNGLNVLDADRLHVLCPAAIDVPVGLLHGFERIVLPEVRVDWDL